MSGVLKSLQRVYPFRGDEGGMLQNCSASTKIYICCTENQRSHLLTDEHDTHVLPSEIASVISKEESPVRLLP